MRIGFHYHIAFYKEGDNVYVPDFFGIFIDSIANNVDGVTLFLHSNNKRTEDDNYKLLSQNLEIVNLGPVKSFYARFFTPSRYFKIIHNNLTDLDCVLVRAPTPLAPYFWFKFHKGVPIYFFLVGSYTKTATHIKTKWYRKIPILLLLHLYQLFQDFAVKRTKIISNSLEILNDYANRTIDFKLIKTTNLNKNSYFERKDTFTNSKTIFLYAGRIEYMKGLTELVHAFAKYNKLYPNSELRIVGWEEGKEMTYKLSLEKLAIQLGVSEKIIFPGRMQLGSELDLEYRNADVFVMPSYAEGFPRAIWEAMANSLPVIATKVGSIPFFLKHDQDCVLINPRNIEELFDGFIKLTNNPKLRETLILNGNIQVKELTIDVQSLQLINVIKNFINEKAE
jgi:glycosyltransferase involved in cell wall biosynthesis